MSLSGTLRTLTLFLVLVLLHFSLRPFLGWRAEPDFLLIAVLLLAVRTRPGVAALLGCVVGLLADALTPSAFGAGALGLAVVAFSASWLKPVFFADSIPLNWLFFFAGTWGFDLVRLAAERRVRGAEFILEAFVWSPLAAAVTAVAGVIVILVLRPLVQRQSA